MDNFINLAKKGYEAYSEHSQGRSDDDDSYRKTGGEEYNSPHHSQQGAGYDSPQIDHDEAVRTAQNHGSGDSSQFSSALSFVNNNKSQHNEPVDEDDVQDSHRKAYQEDSAGALPASSMGSAAALQVLKSFTSGSSGGSGGRSQTDLISMAMAEASKLFDKSGGASSGGKQDAINSAGMTVMKLLVQSKFSAATGGGSSGGLGGLMGLASKFM
ncbi:hypothetical protein BC834DRAFT_921195 [Gloeopeniophorella convolvens]|nr:hypothetical protein BC834DRAFT_921195 [Gloeopeniophorella convolvens]